MQIILPHDHFDADHLEAVVAEMRVLGAPTIKAVDMTDLYGAFVSLEGSHRIRAAAILGLKPIIDEVEWSDTATTDDVVPGSYDDCWTIEEIVDAAPANSTITF